MCHNHRFAGLRDRKAPQLLSLATVLTVTGLGLIGACSDDSTTRGDGDMDAGVDARRDGSTPPRDGAPLDLPTGTEASTKPDQSAGSDGPATSCAAKTLLAELGQSALLVGAAMEDATAKGTPFTLRYQYLAGGIFDQSGPCASCASGCTAGGASCTGGGCGWWGCWQWDEILHASGVGEGAPEVS